MNGFESNVLVRCVLYCIIVYAVVSFGDEQDEGHIILFHHIKCEIACADVQL
jgi:hypothetical protein